MEERFGDDWAAVLVEMAEAHAIDVIGTLVYAAHEALVISVNVRLAQVFYRRVVVRSYPKKKMDMPAKQVTAIRSERFCSVEATIQELVGFTVKKPIVDDKNGMRGRICKG